VYVQAFPSPSGRRRVSASGGKDPLWTEDGKRLLFSTLDGTMMSVGVHLGDRFSFDVGRPMFRMPLMDARRMITSVDGDRFLTSVLVRSPLSMNATMILNWTAALRK